MPESGSLQAGQLMNEISNALVALHREHFGRGPGAAKCTLQGDVLVSTMTDVFTPVERTLIDAGEQERVREMRLAHQMTLREEFERQVSELSSRRVRAFVSGVHFDPDMAVEVFYLDPPDG